MSRPRLHWFWRGAIAVAVGAVVGLVMYLAIMAQFRSLVMGMLQVAGEAATLLLLFFAPASLGGVVAYGLITRYCGPERQDNETRCRKCGYILRGIPEPRCSECGERI